MQHHASVRDRSHHSPRHTTGTEKGTLIPSHQQLGPSAPGPEQATEDEIRPIHSAVKQPPNPPPLEHSPDDAFRKGHTTKVSSSPRTRELRLSPELLGGVGGRGSPPNPSARETAPKGDVFSVAAMPARGFPRIRTQPPDPHTRHPTNGNQSRQEPGTARIRADRG